MKIPRFSRLLAGRFALAVLLASGAAVAGPYSAGLNDPTNPHDAPVPGFVGPDGEGGAVLSDGFDGLINARNFINPLFFGWAATVTNYAPAPGVSTMWSDPEFALKLVTGDFTDVVSLGDLSATQLSMGAPPGTLTVRFDQPIRDLSGADFAIFENALIAGSNTGGAGQGGVFGELAFVEVSSDGLNFVRFPATSLTAGPVGAYGSIDPTNIRQLAGKHVNANGKSWGTPFDLAAVGLSSAVAVRLVDIPGTGAFRDSANRPIYDASVTSESGGFDAEAIGAISQRMTFAAWLDLRGVFGANRGPLVDLDRNGVPNLLEYAFSRMPTRVDEKAAPTSVEIANDRLVLTFTRDERASDLHYEIQAADTLEPNAWTTIARSSNGLPTAGANGYFPVITETSASHIVSIGVIRKVRVADVVTTLGRARRFLRVQVSQIAPQ